MEILMLVLFYYLSQNPDFSESVKPLMSQIKDSEQMLRFLNDLSSFTKTFSTLQKQTDEQIKKQSKPPTDTQPKTDEKTENPQSPTSGIADEFIQNILESYLKKR
jgi:hypothetical protein